MPTTNKRNQRNYRQNCSLAFTAELLGERWTPLILRELFIQPCTFGQLETHLRGIGTNLLSTRLKYLEQQNLVAKTIAQGRRANYTLTALGNTLEPILLSMTQWGFRYLKGNEDYHHFAHWDLFALKALFNGGQGMQNVNIQFASRSLTAWINISNGTFSFGMGYGAPTDNVINTDIRGLYEQLQTRPASLNQTLRQFAEYFDLQKVIRPIDDQ